MTSAVDQSSSTLDRSSGGLARSPETPLWQAIKLVASREISVKLRDKTFLFSTLFFLLFTIGSFVVPTLLDGGPTKVAVTSTAAADTLTRAGHEVRQVPDDAAAERLLRDGDVEAAVVADGTSGVRVLAMDEPPTEMVDAMSSKPPVQLLNPDTIDPVVASLVPIAFGFVFFLTSITFGIQIAQSVTEEKQTRIVEILVATVRPRALLADKVVASSLLAMGQIVLLAVAALISMQLTDTGALLTLLGPAIGWFVPFFIVGFVMLAALWAVAGALVSRMEDLTSTATPVQMLVMLPFFAVAFLNKNETVLAVLSYVPFSAPMAMPIRLFLGHAQPWELPLSLAVLLATTVACVLLGARVYEGSLLRTSGKTKLAVAWAQRAS
jgi:ABC-2 type transport system permease protein